MHEFGKLGITSASAWTSFGWDPNALVHPFDGITPVGAVLGLVSDEVIGLRAVSTPSFFDTQDEQREVVAVRVFESDTKLVAYTVNLTGEAQDLVLDLSEYWGDLEPSALNELQTSLSVIGVAVGADPRSSKSLVDIEKPLFGDFLQEPGKFAIHLDPYEVGQLTIKVPFIFGTDGSDGMSGSSLDDIVIAFGGSDKILGWNGDDMLFGGDGNDELFGHFGDDTLFGGKGVDAFWGGDGSDTVSFEAETSGVVVDLLFRERMSGSAAGEKLYSIENIVGTDYVDTIRGDWHQNILFGGKDDDELIGRAGKDSLYGGKGSDDLYGGKGDDTLFGGDGNDRLVGRSGADVIYGGAGDDQLFGGDGDDTLEGGTGRDSLSGGKGSDHFIVDYSPESESQSAISDLIVDFEFGKDKLIFRPSDWGLSESEFSKTVGSFSTSYDSQTQQLDILDQTGATLISLEDVTQKEFEQFDLNSDFDTTV
jgi:hypothetical protein